MEVYTLTPADALDTVENVENAINKARRHARRENGGQDAWFVYVGTVEGRSVRLKSYGTNVQRFECPAWTDGGPMDPTVGGFRKWMADTLRRVVRDCPVVTAD